MGSSRFPGKPLAPIHGVPMIGHVFKRVEMSENLDFVYVATCDQEIFDYIQSIGGNAVMTSDSHERCTDRTAEAIEILESKLNVNFEIVLMVQGDEPMVTPTMIQSSLEAMFQDEGVNVVNLVAKIDSKDEFSDPNEVKVVKDLKNNATNKKFFVCGFFLMNKNVIKIIANKIIHPGKSLELRLTIKCSVTLSIN